MSQQIQSFLQQMEAKFQQSFSEKNLHQIENRPLNPESDKKNIQKTKLIQINQKKLFLEEGDLKKQLLKQLQQTQKSQQTASNEKEEKNAQKNTNKNFDRETTPHFKQNNDLHDYEIDDLKKAISHQQFTAIAQNFETEYISTNHNDKNPFYYKELTMKLQKALQKISSDKIIRMNNKSSQNTLINRFQKQQQRRKRQIQRKKQQKQQAIQKSLRSTPLINSHSRSLIQQCQQDPIYLRYQKIIAKKKQKQKQYQKIKQQREEKQYEKYKNQFQSYMEQIKQKYKTNPIRTSEQYYQQMQIWLKAKQKNIESQMSQKLQKQKKQHSFKPLINSKSQKILLTKKEEKRVPIYQREPKPKRQIVDPQCTFQPKINKGNFYKKKSSYYQKQYY